MKSGIGHDEESTNIYFGTISETERLKDSMATKSYILLSILFGWTFVY